MSDFSHRILQPSEVNGPFPPHEAPVGKRLELFSQWLLYTLEADLRDINPQPAYRCGASILPNQSLTTQCLRMVDTNIVHKLNQAAEGSADQTPLPRIRNGGGGIIHLIGYRAKNQEYMFDSILYRGQLTASHAPTAPGYWALRTVRLLDQA